MPVGEESLLSKKMEEDIRTIATAYHKLLTLIDWSDPVFVSGIREGKNKFLSNAWLSHTRRNKYYKTNWISLEALSKVKNGDFTNLVFEHLVPKQKYIQDPCERMAMENRLSLEYVVDLLMKYWHTATITKDEDNRLLRRSAPEDWDGVDVRARYKIANIDLIQNPFFSNPTEEELEQRE